MFDTCCQTHSGVLAAIVSARLLTVFRCECATVPDHPPEETAFEPGSIIPAGQWRPMTGVDVKAVTAPRRPRDSTLVEVVRPPDRQGLPLEALTAPLGDPDGV